MGFRPCRIMVDNSWTVIWKAPSPDESDGPEMGRRQFGPQGCREGITDGNIKCLGNKRHSVGQEQFGSAQERSVARIRNNQVIVVEEAVDCLKKSLQSDFFGGHGGEV